jgi:hypothetical protein
VVSVGGADQYPFKLDKVSAEIGLVQTWLQVEYNFY